jgi:hypothetical protein
MEDDHGGTPVRSASFAEATRLLRIAALARVIDEPGHPARVDPLLQGRLALRARTVDVAVDTAVADAARALLAQGWTAAEIHARGAQRLDRPELEFVVDALAASARPDGSYLTRWAARNRRTRGDAVRAAVEVLALLSYVPARRASPTG